MAQIDQTCAVAAQSQLRTSIPSAGSIFDSPSFDKTAFRQIFPGGFWSGSVFKTFLEVELKQFPQLQAELAGRVEFSDVLGGQHSLDLRRAMRDVLMHDAEAKLNGGEIYYSAIGDDMIVYPERRRQQISSQIGKSWGKLRRICHVASANEEGRNANSAKRFDPSNGSTRRLTNVEDAISRHEETRIIARDLAVRYLASRPGPSNAGGNHTPNSYACDLTTGRHPLAPDEVWWARKIFAYRLTHMVYATWLKGALGINFDSDCEEVDENEWTGRWYEEHLLAEGLQASHCCDKVEKDNIYEGFLRIICSGRLFPKRPLGFCDQKYNKGSRYLGIAFVEAELTREEVRSAVRKARDFKDQWINFLVEDLQQKQHLRHAALVAFDSYMRRSTSAHNIGCCDHMYGSGW